MAKRKIKRAKEAEIQDKDVEYEADDESISMQSSNLSDRQIEKIFDQGRFRLQQDRNDFTLPQVLDFVQTKTWINIRPEYQRRLRWERQKKSRLIESFIMNVPVPPIFLYEYDINRYEVMDGQQRLNSIIEFFNNEFALSGLKVWSSLNGKRIRKLPPRVRRGLERAKISSIILLTDVSADTNSTIGDIRTQVFDRLNTGGVKLNAQELRNCLYSGPLNELIIKLSGKRQFTDIWGIPPHDENVSEGGVIGEKLRRNSLFANMKDCEIVLRFFAFRKEGNIRGSVRSILDRYMLENRNASKDDIDAYRIAFLTSLKLATKVFGEHTFRLLPTDSGRRPLSRPLYDAIMVTFDRLSGKRKKLLKRRKKVISSIEKALNDPETYNVIIGRPNTADAIKSRINKIHELVVSAID